MPDKIELPSLHTWLTMPRDELSAIVRTHHLTLLMDNDGTRRHYLIDCLRRGQSPNLEDSFEDYSRFTAEAHVRVFDLMLSLGVEQIVTPLFAAGHFTRSRKFLELSAEMTRLLLGSEAFAELYDRWPVKVRFYGDYDIVPAAEPMRDAIQSMAHNLIERTPDGSRTLHYGFCAGSFGEEMLQRTIQLQAELGQPPTLHQVRNAAFAPGLERIDILITAGQLRVGQLLPPLLNTDQTDIYCLNYLLMDITEATLRRILYDHIFLREATDYHNIMYTDENLRDLQAYYKAHEGDFTGEGHLVGPGLWYPDTPEN